MGRHTAKRSFGEILVLLRAAWPQVSGKGISRIHRVDIGRPTCSLVNRKQFANVTSYSACCTSAHKRKKERKVKALLWSLTFIRELAAFVLNADFYVKIHPHVRCTICLLVCFRNYI